MATNPLYPGYAPERPDDMNPLYPGYYTGKAIPRRPVKRDYLKGTEYSFDEMLMYIDNIDYSVQGLPTWAKERYLDDFKSQLKASILPMGVSNEQLNDYDEGELPGALGVGISLDPTEWAEDPEKQLKKTLNTWFKTVTGIDALDVSKTDFGDFEDRVRRRVWSQMLTDFDEEDEDHPLPKPIRKAAEVAVQRTVQGSSTTDADFGGSKNPLALESKRDKRFAEYGYDASVSPAMGIFCNRTALMKRRSDQEFLINSLTSFNRETQAELARGTLNELNAMGVMEPGRVAAAAELLDLKIRAVTSIKGVNDIAFGKDGSIKEAADKLSTFALLDDIGGKLGMAPQDKIQHDAFIKQAVSGLGKLGTEVEKAKDEYKAILEAAKTLDVNRAYPQLTKQLSPWKKYLDNLEREVNIFDRRFASGNVSVNDCLAMGRSFRNVTVGPRSLGVFSASLADGDILNEGLLNQFLHSTVDELLDSRGPHVHLKVLLDAKQTEHFAGRRLMYLWSRARVEKYTTDFEDVWDALESGKYMERTFWTNRLARTMAYYTWATVGQYVMTSFHYFGFKFDERLNDPKLLDSQLPKFTQNAAFKKVFGYRFTLDLDKTGIKGAGNSFGFRYMKGIDGGPQFQIIGGLAGLKDAAGQKIQYLEATSQGRLLALGVLKGDMNAPDAVATVEKLLENAGVDSAKKTLEEQAKNLVTQSKLFQEWLKTNGAKFGLPAVLNDAQTMQLFEAFRLENTAIETLNITTRFAGFMQKLNVLFNKIQKGLLGLPYVGYFLQGYVTFRMILEDSISFAISNAIGGFLSTFATTATAGIGLLIKPFIDKLLIPLIRVITKRIIGAFTGFFGALATGDFFKAFETFEKSLAGVLKTVFLIVGLPILLLGAFVYALFGNVAAIAPSVDPTRSDQALQMAGGGAIKPLGENDYVKIEKTVYVKDRAAGGESWINPENGTIPNSVAATGFDVYYEITITPKVTLADKVFKWSDSMRVLHSDVPWVTPMGSPSVDHTDLGQPFDTENPIKIRLPEGTGVYSFGADPQWENSYFTNSVTIHMPAIEVEGEELYPEEDVTYVRSFEIGEYVSECPVLGKYRVMTTVYPVGHGSESYWGNIGVPCTYAIPYIWTRTGCDGDHMGNMCVPKGAHVCKAADVFGPVEGYDEYGYAVDIAPVNPSASGKYEVVFPNLSKLYETKYTSLNSVKFWRTEKSTTCMANYGGSWGYGLTAVSNDGNYRIYFTHLNADTKGCTEEMEIAPGDIIGTLFTGWSSASQIHIHIELIDLQNNKYAGFSGKGVPVNPFDAMCNKSE